MKKAKKRKKQVSQGRRKRGRRNEIAMVSISFVVCVLFVALLFEGVSLYKKIEGYEGKKENIVQEIAREDERTKEIEDLKEYMQSDEYAEVTAREKLGLVKENEIVFKEED